VIHRGAAREVMLVDAQLTNTSAEKVLPQIEETKKRWHIYITHAQRSLSWYGGF